MKSFRIMHSLMNFLMSRFIARSWLVCGCAVRCFVLRVSGGIVSCTGEIATSIDERGECAVETPSNEPKHVLFGFWSQTFVSPVDDGYAR